MNLKSFEKKHPDFFRLAYLPVLSNNKNEAQLKWGNTVPLPNIMFYPSFFKHKNFDKWPLYLNNKNKKVKAVFVMQFYDPRPKNQYGDGLIQVWVPQLDDISGCCDNSEKAILRIVPSQIYHSKKEFFIDPPAYEDKPSDKPGYIINWEKRKERGTGVDFEQFQTKLTKSEEKFWDALKPNVAHGLKIDGFGFTMQGNLYNSWITNIYDGQHGDAGSVHIFENDLHIEGDMG